MGSCPPAFQKIKKEFKKLITRTLEREVHRIWDFVHSIAQSVHKIMVRIRNKGSRISEGLKTWTLSFFFQHLKKKKSTSDWSQLIKCYKEARNSRYKCNNYKSTPSHTVATENSYLWYTRDSFLVQSLPRHFHTIRIFWHSRTVCQPKNKRFEPC